MLPRQIRVATALAHHLTSNGFGVYLLPQPDAALALVTHGPDTLLVLVPVEGDRVAPHTITESAEHPMHDEAVRVIYDTINSPEWAAEFSEPVPYPAEAADA